MNVTTTIMISKSTTITQLDTNTLLKQGEGVREDTIRLAKVPNLTGSVIKTEKEAEAEAVAVAPTLTKTVDVYPNQFKIIKPLRLKSSSLTLIVIHQNHQRNPKSLCCFLQTRN